MAEKDTATKSLESYNDVFADIVNVYLFGGEQEIDPDDMSPDEVFSQYKADGKLRFQERDCAKIWKDHNDEAVIALFCIENQVAVDKFLTVRVIGYDGAAYRVQLNKNSTKDGENITNEKTVIHPVLTLVLYFGESEWTAPTTLYECMNVPEKLKTYVNDYRITVIDVKKTTDEQLHQFKSDFKYIADVFKNGIKDPENYQPIDNKSFQHGQAVADFFTVFFKDESFLEIYNESQSKGDFGMCEFTEKLAAKGRAEGRAEGKKFERETGIKNTVSLCKSFGADLKKTIEKLVELYSLSEDEAAIKANQYWNPI